LEKALSKIGTGLTDQGIKKSAVLKDNYLTLLGLGQQATNVRESKPQ
jgi:hypothetical protein